MQLTLAEALTKAFVMAFQFVTGQFFIQSLCKKLNEATPPSNKLEDGLDLENILKRRCSIRHEQNVYRNEKLLQVQEEGLPKGKELDEATEIENTLYETIRWEVSLSKSIFILTRRATVLNDEKAPGTLSKIVYL